MLGLPLAAGLTLAFAAPALGAGVTLASPSPANDALIPTQPVPYSIPFAWTRDTSGCAVPAAGTTTFRIFGPNGFSDSTTSTGPASDAATFTAGAAKPTKYSWFVDFACGNLTTRSEIRTFTLQGPNLAPRFKGRYLVTVGGNRQIWRFAPRCRRGACTTLAKRPGSGWFPLRWNPRKKSYSGKIAKLSTAKERVCRITTRRGGRVIRTRTVRNVYEARNVTVKLKVARTRINVDGTVTFAQSLRGAHRAKYLPKARGRKLGCPASSRLSAKITANRR